MAGAAPMAKAELHPEAQEDGVGAPEDPQAVITACVNDLCQQVKDAQGDRQDWVDNQTKWFKQRYGIRGRKTFPWPDASNLHLPLTDSVIKNLLAKFDRLVFGSIPIAACEPTGAETAEDAKRVEGFMDWLLRSRMHNEHIGFSFRAQLSVANSRMTEQGFAILKMTWEERTRPVRETLDVSELPDDFQQLVLMLRGEVPEGMQIEGDLLDAVAGAGSPEEFAGIVIADFYNMDLEADAKKIGKIVKEIKRGEDVVTFTYNEICYSAPYMKSIDSADFIVPADTMHLQHARFACERMWFSQQQIEEKGHIGMWGNIAKLYPPRSGATNNRLVHPTNAASGQAQGRNGIELLPMVKRDKEGVRETGTSSDLREIWELHFWYREDDEEPLQRYYAVVDAETKTILRGPKPLPYDHGLLPYVQISRERYDTRFHSSRGVPETVRDLQAELNVSINQQTDRETINNAPFYTYLTGSGFSPGQLRWIPGQGVGVQRHEVLNFPQRPRNDIPGEPENRRREIKSWAEQLTGSQDYGLSKQTNQGGGPRTAYEVGQVNALSELLFGMDAGVYSDQLACVFFHIFSLWHQYGDDDVWVRSARTKPARVSRKDLMGGYKFMLVGKADSSNPLLRAQKAQFRMGILTPYVDRPLPGAGGKLWMIHSADLIRDFAEEDDARAAAGYLHEMTPEEVQQYQQAQQASQMQAQQQAMGAHAAAGGLEMMGGGGGPRPPTPAGAPPVGGA